MSLVLKIAGGVILGLVAFYVGKYWFDQQVERTGFAHAINGCIEQTAAEEKLPHDNVPVMYILPCMADKGYALQPVYTKDAPQTWRNINTGAIETP